VADEFHSSDNNTSPTPPHAGLAAISALRRLLDGREEMLVINRRGDLSPRTFAFGPPSSEETVAEVERELQVTFPAAYRTLLLAYDGLTLFEDTGLWGFRILGTTDLVAAQESYRGMHRRIPWPPTYVVVAHSIGDLDALVMDTARTTRDGTDCVVLDAAAEERADQWHVAASSMSQWVDCLIVSQGSKFWLWK
jgi:SMI1/KNR4 family protein SUKH-1